MKFTASVANLSSTVSASALPRKKASNGLSLLLLLLLLLLLSSKLFEFGLEEKIRNVSFPFFSLLPATFARTREEEEEEEEEEDDDKRRLESATTRFETRATGIFCARVLSFSLKKNEASSSFVVGRVLFSYTSSDDDDDDDGNGGREIRFARDDDENDERRLR